MVNEHTEYSDEVDVPVEAIQFIDPNVVASRLHFLIMLATMLYGSIEKKSALLDVSPISNLPCYRAA